MAASSNLDQRRRAMSDPKSSLREFIEQAIKLEVHGQSFFQKAAELTHNDLGKKMFLRLAKEETKHLDDFSKLFSSVLGSDEWKKLVSRERLKGPSPVIEQLTARLKRAEAKSDVEALRLGQELELKAVDFFKGCAAGTNDSAVKNIFEKISEEEKFHYDLLQAQVDSLTKTGFWLDSSEFSMDGKF
jgi:rubrerythrin